MDDTPTAPRALGLGILGCAAFGAAALVGRGPAPALHGALAAPALFVGGALLATPPLYLAGAFGGAAIDAETLLRKVSGVVGDCGVALLGLAAPAAFFSVTLRTGAAPALLIAACVVAGALCVEAAGRAVLGAGGAAARAAWTLFALALGMRLMAALAPFVRGVA